MAEKIENLLGFYETIKDRDGKAHRVYSCKIKDLCKLKEFTTKYNPVYLQIQALEPWLDDEGKPKMDEDGNALLMFQNPEFMDGIYEVVEMALDYKETRKDIEKWLDFSLLVDIVQTFLGLSQFKKKVM